MSKMETEVRLNGPETEVIPMKTRDVAEEEERNAGRDSWSGKLDFMFSCIGYSIGLGNVWRFPYLCYKNGGGAFLIPYLITLLCAGIPMFFLELSLGQYMATGCVGVWKISPIFKGVGYAMLVASMWLNLFYIVILAWALFYLYHSFTSALPWASCTNDWNTVDCLSEYGCATANASSCLRSNRSVSPVQEFWERKALQITSGLGDPGSVRGELAVCLLIAWICCYFCIWKGVRWTGKIVWFTSLFPYLLLVILMIRGCTLPGAIDGIVFYLHPDLSRLGDSQVWVDAVTQVFFSYGLAVGAQIALGSYNKYHNNCYKDALIVSCVNSSTSLFSGFVIFSVIGFMAKQQGLKVSEVAEQGPGLAFVAYPSAIAQMPISPFWATLFFLMLFFVGLDSQFCTLEGFITGCVDEWPKYLRPRKEIFTAIVCALSYLVGLSMVTQGGMYVFELMNSYPGSGITLLFLIFFESIGIGWGYGASRFYDNLHDMIGYRPCFWWKVCWVGITPAACLGVIVFHIIAKKPFKYNTYTYPGWANAIGWAMTVSVLFLIPAYAIYKFSTTAGTFHQRCRLLFRPDVDEPIKKSRNEAAGRDF